MVNKSGLCTSTQCLIAMALQSPQPNHFYKIYEKGATKKGDYSIFTNDEAILKVRDDNFKLQCEEGKRNVKGYYVDVILEERYLKSMVRKFAQADIPAPLNYNQAKTVVVDFSSPNIAKEMHVGHLRSTVIGNSLALINEYVGNNTIRVNHIGDWGAQFGMLLQFLKENQIKVSEQTRLKDLTNYYKQARKHYDENPEFQVESKKQVVLLQSQKDEQVTKQWQSLVDTSLRGFEQIYQKLGVFFPPETIKGESWYQNYVDVMLRDLPPQTLRFQPNNPSIELPTNVLVNNKTPHVLVLRKSDGSIGYDATDLAALHYRIKELKAREIVYVTDKGQELHFQSLFDAALRIGKWDGEDDDAITLKHVKFGVVHKMGGGGKIKTRDANENQSLEWLLTEASATVRSILHNKIRFQNLYNRNDWPQFYDKLGAYSLIFNDLKTKAELDYELNLPRLCNPNGDTVLYLIYLAESTKTLIAKSQQEKQEYNEAERNLALQICKFYDYVERAHEHYAPHVLCVYVLQLARQLSAYSLQAADLDTPLLQAACAVIIQTLKLLGIPPI